MDFKKIVIVFWELTYLGGLPKLGTLLGNKVPPNLKLAKYANNKSHKDDMKLTSKAHISRTKSA